MGKYVWPCPSYSRISSGYGNRVHPIYGTVKFHDGVDLAAASGVPILAFGSGTVTVSGLNGGYGNYISINHGGGLMSFIRTLFETVCFQGRKSHRRSENRGRWYNWQLDRLSPAFWYALERFVGQSAELCIVEGHSI